MTHSTLTFHVLPRSRASTEKHKRARYRLIIKFLIAVANVARHDDFSICESAYYFRRVSRRWLARDMRNLRVWLRAGFRQSERTWMNSLLLMSAVCIHWGGLFSRDCPHSFARTGPDIMRACVTKPCNVPAGWAPACFPTDRTIIALVLDRPCKRSMHNLFLEHASFMHPESHASRCIIHDVRLASIRIEYIREL